MNVHQLSGFCREDFFIEHSSFLASIGGMKIWCKCLLIAFAPLIAQAAELPDGLVGLKAPESQSMPGGKLAYHYPEALVVVTPSTSEVGEEIAVYKKAKSGAKNVRILSIPNDSANYFAGLAGDAVFVISQTGPDASLSIYSLATKNKVFEAGFREPARVRGSSVEFEKLLKGGLNSLTPAEAQAYPKVAALMKQGLSAGWFQKVRLSLDSYNEKPIGKPVLHEMQ